MGEQKKALRLFEFDENFGRLYEQEKMRLQGVLGDTEIEHVGSTAVQGMMGKGVVDILVGVRAQEDLEQVMEKLVGLGYFADRDTKPQDDRKFLASREHDSTIGDYHLHIVVRGGDEWEKMLLLRDKLRESETLRAEYAKLKKKLLRETDANRRAYKRMKGEFIERALGLL